MRLTWIHNLMLSAAVAVTAWCCAADAHAADGGLVVASETSNDLYQALCASLDKPPARYDTPLEAVRRAPRQSGVLLLADGYPDQPLAVPAEVFRIAADKGLKLYLEYPADGVAGLAVGPPAVNGVRRLVVHPQDDAGLPGLEAYAILDAHEAWFVPVTREVASDHQVLTLARVAGYDTALFRYTRGADPVPALFMHEDPASGARVLVATTALSHFIRGRFAPVARWDTLWEDILEQMSPGSGEIELDWEPLTRPMYAEDEPLPEDARALAIARGVHWFAQARQLIHPDWAEIANQRGRTHDLSILHSPGMGADQPNGDGSLGILEGTVNPLYPDGSQAIRWWVRNDDVGEAAMAYAFHGLLADDDHSQRVGSNLLGFLRDSRLSSGAKSDPKSNVYGLRAWNTCDVNLNTFYSDDIARSQIGQIGAGAALKTDEWDEVLAVQILASFRFTGTNGFWAQDRYDGTLEGMDWRDLHESTPNPASRVHPHFEAYKLAPFLWLYGQTGYEPLLERSRTALGLMVTALREGRILWTNGVQQERARLVLPLAWLVRVDDTPEHREWLAFVVGELLKNQQDCGGIIEEVGNGGGYYPPPSSNDQFGTNEAPVIQENGDPGIDLLYTTNFAFKGLIEAAAVMDDPRVDRAVQKMADFLVRVQVASDRPQLDGQWLRGFDFAKWDYWGSDSDHGWGVWGNQSGWTQSEILAGLVLVEMETSLWDLSRDSHIDEVFPEVLAQMFPPAPPGRGQVEHAAVGCRVTLEAPSDDRYIGHGAAGLVDGERARRSHTHSGWLGYSGADLTATIDLGEATDIKTLGVGVLQSIPMGIYLPRLIEFSVSNDGESFEVLTTIEPDASQRNSAQPPLILAENLEARVRFIRVRVAHAGTIPAGQPGSGSPAWLFVDEVVVNPQALVPEPEATP